MDGTEEVNPLTQETTAGEAPPVNETAANQGRQTQAVKTKRKSRRTPPGSSPGVFNIPEDALKPKVTIFSYDQNSIDEKQVTNVSALKTIIDAAPAKTHWIDIRGFGDRKFFEKLSDQFSIHRLLMEDVFNVYQRPKAEEQDESLFLISRCMRMDNGSITNDQLSIFLKEKIVISFQEKYNDLLDPVRTRLRNGKGYIRKYGSDYIAYALMDVVLDNFYPILEKLGEGLDTLQDELIDKPVRSSLNDVLDAKRNLILLRRTIWSERDKLNDILRSDFAVISDPVKIFFRDSYDHCVQILDLVESYKEMTASLMDVYMSSVSNRMNQIMKVLTIISTIFIPLTFIVGLYGMNFMHKDPFTGEPLPMNMPELYSPYGYVGVIAFMTLLVIIMIIFFINKGWLTKGKE